MRDVNPHLPCPCGSGHPYSRCCQPLHDGAPAPSAEALMRSRFTAYALRLDGYLLASWHVSQRPPSLSLAGDPTEWLGLQIKHHAMTGENTAVVSFVARYRTRGVGGGRAGRLEETSRFVREDGRWYYLDGDVGACATRSGA